MRWVTSHAGELSVEERADSSGQAGAILRGFDGLLVAGAVHEFLFAGTPGHPTPLYPVLMLAGEAATKADRFAGVVWCDSNGRAYPPALHRLGIRLDRLCLLRPPPEMATWAVMESLRCKGVGAVVASFPRGLAQVEARRLQLAAERGGSLGIFLRPERSGPDFYAAATRWRISPHPASRGVQRWTIQLIHGHGRLVGQSFVLESHRAADPEFTTQPLPLHLSDGAEGGALRRTLR